ncbi:MAG TPA: alpha-L-fucosidase [Bacteroidales bacterium]|nr:alpha-L-fucosidase [Bacteroidales bacterium]
MRKAVFIIFILVQLTCSCSTKRVNDDNEIGKVAETGIPEWFRDGKFGMFIHWGPYSVFAGEWKDKRIKQGDIAEWIMKRFEIPVDEYRMVAATFNPVEFSAGEWVKIAKDAGMKYMIITSKHHDGFAMYDSEVSDYNIVDYTPFKRDPLKELSEACAAEGIKFGVYYSHREDWEHPYAYGNTWDFDSSQTNLDEMDYPLLFRKYLDEKAIPQLKELLTNYGSLGIVWFDRGMYTQEQGKEFADLVHNMQPQCLVNGRVGHYDKELLGDYQSLTDNGMPVGGIEEYWETPQTLNDTWGYCKFDTNWKQPDEIIRRLAAIVSKGGNYLLNVGPTGEGIIPEASVNILKRVGDWMDDYGESIYGTSPSPFPYEIPWGYCTRKNNVLYLHVFDWPEDGIINLRGLNNEIVKAYMLVNKDNELELKSDNGKTEIFLPDSPSDDINSVVVLEIDGEVDIDPVIVVQDDSGQVQLDYLTASTSGRAVKRFNRKGEEGQFHISKMQGPDDYIEWHVDFKVAGNYELMLTYAAIPGWEDCTYIIEAGDMKVKGKVKSTEGWYEYKTEKAGQLRITEHGLTTIRLFPKNQLDHYLMYFSKIELIPLSV